MTELMTMALVALQVGILVLSMEALRRRDIAAAVNALVSFVATLLPAAVEYASVVGFDRSVTFGTALALWIAVAGFLHSVGMLGPYDSVWWWDHLTHLVSAALVAALFYASLLVVGQDATVTNLVPESAGVLTVLLTFVVGVFWEVLELVARRVGRRYDVKPVLVHYGWRDTAFDLVFDVLGALLVVLFDLRVFVPVAEQAPEFTKVALVGGNLLVLVGTALIVLGLEADRGFGS